MAILPRVRISTALMGCVLLSLMLGASGSWIFKVWKNGNELLAEELVKFDRLRSVAAYAKVLSSLNPNTEDKIYSELFLKGKTEAVVSADILTQLKQMASTRGVEVVRASDLPSKTEGPITLVGGGLEMSGKITNIFNFVQDIEMAKPVLFLDYLTMRTNGVNGEEGRNDTMLVVEMQVFGAIRSSQFLSSSKAPQ